MMKSHYDQKVQNLTSSGPNFTIDLKVSLGTTC